MIKNEDMYALGKICHFEFWGFKRLGTCAYLNDRQCSPAANIFCLFICWEWFADHGRNLGPIKKIEMLPIFQIFPWQSEKIRNVCDLHCSIFISQKNLRQSGNSKISDCLGFSQHTLYEKQPERSFLDFNGCCVAFRYLLPRLLSPFCQCANCHHPGWPAGQRQDIHG